MQHTTQFTRAGTAKKMGSPSAKRMNRKKDNPFNCSPENGKSSGISLRSSASSKIAPFKSNVRVSPGEPSISTTSVEESASRILASQREAKSAKSKAKNDTTVLSLFHFLRISNPSVDEIMFASLMREFGYITTTWFAGKFSLKCRRTITIMGKLFHKETT